MKIFTRIAFLYLFIGIPLGSVAHAQAAQIAEIGIEAIKAFPDIVKGLGGLPNIITDITANVKNAKYIRDTDNPSVILVKHPIEEQKLKSPKSINDLIKNRIPKGEPLDDTNDGYSFVHVKSSKYGGADYRMVPRSQVDSKKIKDALENPDPHANKVFMQNVNELADSDRFKSGATNNQFNPGSDGARLGWQTTFNQQHAVILGKGGTLKFNLGFGSPEFIIDLAREFDPLITDLIEAKKATTEDERPNAVAAVMKKYNMINNWFPVTSETTGFTLYFYLPDILDRLKAR